MPTSDTFEPGIVRSARRVSELSVVWTVCASSLSIVFGIGGGSVVLVAIGAVGYVDAIGSVALAHHFRHGLRHEQLADRFERRAHRVVIVGLCAVGISTIVVSAVRLANGATPHASAAGLVVAVISFLVLTGLSARKRSVARRVNSAALLSDSHLSAVGALQALVAVVGVGLTRSLGWQWADGLAALAVGVVAVALAMTGRRAAVI